MLYLQNCDLSRVFNKHQNFEIFKKIKNYASYKKKSHESKTTFFHILHLSSKFQTFRFNNKKKKKLKTESVPLIDNTNELIRKILSEQLHNQIIYAR